MNTETRHPPHHLETDHEAIPSAEIFVSFAIAMIVVVAIYLVVALLTPISSWTQAASTFAAVWTAGLC